MKNSKALNIMIPPELYERLKAEADRKNISLAAIVRIACSEYLETQLK